MKRIICKYEYDTEAATIVHKHTVGAFGDADGYEETLYQTEDGKFFVYVNGGADSPYSKEDIKRIGKDKVKGWIAERS